MPTEFTAGFAAMTVPAGFTTEVYDRGAGGVLLPPKYLALPVGVDFLGLPFTARRAWAATPTGLLVNTDY